MKTFLGIFLLIASFAFGQTATQTPNLHLSKPALNSTNWGSYMNMNTDLLDQYLSGQLAMPSAFWTGLYSKVPTPVNPADASNRAFTLTSGDWQTIESAVAKIQLSSFSVTTVAKSWNFNSILPAGTGTASFGYGNIWLPSNASFRIAGCIASQWAQAGVTFNTNLQWRCQHAEALGANKIEFIVYSDYFDVIFNGDSSKFRIVIDGRPTSAYYLSTDSSNNPNQYHVQLDGNPHRVSIENMKGSFEGVITPNGPGSTDITSPDWGSTWPEVVAVGNSHLWGQTSTSSNPLLGTTPVGSITFAQRACGLLNWRCHMVGVPGTDYVNTGGGVGNYGAHIASDVCSVSGAKVVWWASGGWNDISTVSSVQAAALTDYQAVASCLPGAVQIVTGPFQPFPASTGVVAVDTAIKAAVLQAQAVGVKIYYVASAIDEQLVTGSHSSCNLVNTSGNACALGAGDDGVHFPQAAHDRFGVWAAMRIHQMLPQLGSPAFDYASPIQALTTQQIVSRHALQQKTGTVSITVNTSTLTGIGTLFTKELRPGWKVAIGPGLGGCNSTNPVTVASIASDTSLTISGSWSSGSGCTTQSGVAYQLAMSPLPEAWGVDGAGNINSNNAVAVSGAKSSGLCPVVQVDNTTVNWGTCVPSSVETAVFLPTISLSSSSSGAISIIPPFDMTVTDLSLLVSTSAAGCTVSPIWTLNDNTIGTSAVITVTFTNGSATTNLAQTGQSYTLIGGHLYTLKTTAGTGCSTSPSYSGGTMFMKRSGT